MLKKSNLRLKTNDNNNNNMKRFDNEIQNSNSRALAPKFQHISR